jgi:4-diphosphocytidyl-2-C-methyl-D-erythritol kinase
MVALPSFAKINLGLKIGAHRPDGFHELRTIYQTLALHDVVRVEVQPGSGIEIRCSDARVPRDETNTCWKIAERVLAFKKRADVLQSDFPQGLKPGSENDLLGTAKAVPLQSAKLVPAEHGKMVIEIEKRLPVQGGLGAASSNAVATMLGLERALGVELDQADRLRIAAEVGSDLPLFLIGGTVLGGGRGEDVHPLPDLTRLHVVVVTPPIGVSTPKAFARWDELGQGSEANGAGLTGDDLARTISESSQSVLDGLAQNVQQAVRGLASGVPAGGGDRAETPLLDLVRTGIENDFERVVFPEYPELREVKELLVREGAQYASLSGSGSTLYGLFASEQEARGAAERMGAAGHSAIATTSLTREEYWKAIKQQLALATFDG